MRGGLRSETFFCNFLQFRNFLQFSAFFPQLLVHFACLITQPTFGGDVELYFSQCSTISKRQHKSDDNGGAHSRKRSQAVASA